MPEEDTADRRRSTPASEEVVADVRPIGYVEDRAVVRRIGDRDMFLGNVHAAERARYDRSFDAVLSLTADERPLTTHHHPLVDGEGNAWAEFAAAVDAARTLHRRDGSVLVHCRAGISRSAAVVATALAAEEGRRFSDAIGEVQAVRPHAVPHPALCELGVLYLAATGSPRRGDRTPGEGSTRRVRSP